MRATPFLVAAIVLGGDLSRFEPVSAVAAVTHTRDDDDEVDREGSDGDEEEEDTIVTDRPDFTEASSTVGRGVIQFEFGYTFFYNDSSVDHTLTRTHTAPELLTRVGICDWVELRLAVNYTGERVVDFGQIDESEGFDDLLVGTKLALRKQAGVLPEAAIIFHTLLPTGKRELSNHGPTFGTNLLYSWDLNDTFSLAMSTGYNTFGEWLDAGPPQNVDRFNFFHQSASLGISLTDSVGMYVEFFGHYLTGAENNSPQNYIDSGLTYLWDADTQFDVRLGKGLNAHADDFFAGAGMSRRFR